MSKELIIRGAYDLSAPEQMAKLAKVLQKHIVEQKLFTPIAGKNYIQVEGWQFAGGLLGYMPRVTKVENLSTGTEKKWRADVEIIRIKDGIIMGNGAAICSNSEAKKKSFDEYAVMSMAQTRAIGKAYRNLIGWVMKTAGYESTPTEEMTKVDGQTADLAQNNVPKQEAKFEVKITPVPNADVYLGKLKKKLFDLGAKDEVQAMAILKKKTNLVWKGFSSHGPVAIRNAYTALLNSK